MSASPRQLARDVKALALAVGFDLAGVARAEANAQTRFLRDWVARGFAGEMHYLVRRLEERVDPRLVLPGARSIISVAVRYATGDEPAKPDGAPLVARYARGEDYHDVLGDRLRALEAGIEAWVEAPVRMRSYVDTGPVQERVYAARAGLGWIGKNTCLIHPGHGSYVFLGALLCDLELEPDTPEPDHCGSCRACLDACPTDAFADPYVLDATRCIAYTTIEDPAPIPEPLRVQHGTRVFGCDVCQEVCPWNRPGRRAGAPDPDPLGLRERLAGADPWLTPSFEWILRLDEASFQKNTRRSPIRRARFRGLLRNALVAAGNSGDASLEPLVRRHAQGDDEVLASHARWALARLSEPPSAREPAPEPARGSR